MESGERMQNKKDNLDSAVSPATVAPADSRPSDVSRSNAELIRLASESILGFPYSPTGSFPIGRCNQFSAERLLPEDGLDLWEWTEATQVWNMRPWNPLASDSDAFMLVEKLTERMEFRAWRGPGKCWEVTFTDYCRREQFTRVEIDRRRAIVIAALRAVATPGTTEDTVSPLCPTETPELADGLQVKPEKEASHV